MNDHCPWSETAQQVVEHHGVSIESGLTEHEAQQRLHHYGPNQLQTTSGRSWLGILVAPVPSLLVFLLAVAATLAFVFHDWIEGIAICAVLVLNAVIGFLPSSVPCAPWSRCGNTTRPGRRSGVVARSGKSRRNIWCQGTLSRWKRATWWLPICASPSARALRSTNLP